MCAAVRLPSSGVPRCPLVPNLTRCRGSPESGVRSRNSRSSLATSIENRGGRGFAREWMQCHQSDLRVPPRIHATVVDECVTEGQEARRIEDQGELGKNALLIPDP